MDHDRLLGDIIEYSDFADAQSVLGLSQTSESLDPAPAKLCRLVAKMDLQSIPNRCAYVRIQAAKVLRGLWREDEVVSH